MHSRWEGKKNISLLTAKNLTLPPFNCGSNFIYQQCQGPYMTANDILNEDTLHIGGFPVLIESLQQSPNSTEIIYGTGWVPLPFGNQVVKVRIGDPNTALSVNINGEICFGTVSGISDDPAYFPDLNPPPIPFGGEICIPPPSSPGFDENGIHNVTGLPWDENGFGPDSLYAKAPPYPGYETGDLIDTSGMYDPWGFDFEGNHINGTNVNENGCTQEQMQEVPQNPPCVAEPYEWMPDSTGTTSPTQQGNALANEVADSLEIWLDQILTQLQLEMEDSIVAKNSECSGIRTSMNTLMGNLGYDRKYIFGANDEYFNEGMYKKFTSKPEPLGVNIDRNGDQEDLEKKHIELYSCDKSLHVFKRFENGLF